jgi:hypothetical protein
MKQAPLLYTYKRTLQTVPINERYWQAVPPQEEPPSVHRRQAKKGKQPEEELKTITKQKVRKIILPDFNTTVDGHPVKLLFRKVDNDGFDVNIIPLDHTILNASGEAVPIVYAARFDLKNRKILINNKESFDLQPLPDDGKMQMTEYPQVYSSWGVKTFKGLVVPTVFGSLRFLLGCLSQCLILAATYFPMAVVSYGVGYAITTLMSLPEMQLKMAKLAAYYAPHVVGHLVTPAVYVITKATTVAKGVLF